MMENINEFIKNFRERLSSPFFFSFLWSWVFINWKVTVALLWYDSSHYQNKGDLIQFIDVNTSTLQSIVLPFVGAILYTGVLRNLVSAFVAFGVRWGGNWNLQISKASKIPMAKFLTYRDLYVKTNRDLEKVIEDERKTIEDFDKERQKVLKLEADNLAMDSQVKKLMSDNEFAEIRRQGLVRDVSQLEARCRDIGDQLAQYEQLVENFNNPIVMNGRWKFFYENKFRGLKMEEELYIVKDVVQTSDQGRYEGILKIEHFFYDTIKQKILLVLSYIPGSSEMVFIQELMSQVTTFKADNSRQRRAYFRLQSEPLFLVHSLNVKDMNTLIGVENGEARIIYERISN